MRQSASDILRWKLPYNFEEEFYQIATALVPERTSQNKAVLICMCLSQFFHPLLEQQGFRNGVQKEACGRVIRNFWFLFSSRLMRSLQDNFSKVVGKYCNWELTRANTFLLMRTKFSLYNLLLEPPMCLSFPKFQPLRLPCFSF